MNDVQIDDWLDAVFSDFRLTASAFKYAWYFARCLRSGEEPVCWRYGGGESRNAMAAYRGARVLQRLGYLHLEKRPGKRAMQSRAVLPKTRKAAAGMERTTDAAAA